MYQYDPIQEFENIQQLNEDILGKLGNMFNKKQNEYPSAAEIVSDFHNKAETNAECPAGSKQNNLFFSELGSPSAIFNGNKVKDISGLDIAKSILRCYDIKTDPLKIAWLFDHSAHYEADKIWGRPGEIYFSGKWKSGVFEGIFVQPYEFLGGTFEGKVLGQDNEIKKQEKPAIKYFESKIPGFELYSNVDLVSSDEMLKFNKFQKDVQSGEFLNILKIFKKMLLNGEIDGYGNFPTLRYLLAQQGNNAQKISQEDAKILQYLVDFKKVILDNVIKKDGTSNEYLKSTFINNMKKFLGLMRQTPITPKPQNIPASTPTPTKNKLSTALKENYNLSVASYIKNSLL